MFSGGDYEEVSRWLANFVTSHAKRESLRAWRPSWRRRAPRESRSYGVRLRLGTRVSPPPGAPPMELDFARCLALHRGDLAWCDALARRVRDLARRLIAEERGEASHRVTRGRRDDELSRAARSAC